MSLLEKQLSKLREELPQTKVSTVRDASFLFPKEKQITPATLRVMALKALYTLSRITPDIAQFEALFSENSLEIDRGLMMKDANEKVSRSLQAFLMQLGPHFLLRPAQICVEYLIRIYNVHLFDLNSLMKCIIPYHGTLPFAAISKLVHAPKESIFHWLVDVQSAREIVPRKFIVSCCRDNLRFFDWIAETAKDFAKLGLNHRVMYSFFTAVYVEYFSVIPNTSFEVILKSALAQLVSGFSDQISSLEYQRGCLMILIQILSLTQLAPAAIEVIIYDVVKKCLETNRLKDALIFSTFVFQSQPIDYLPSRVKDLYFHAEKGGSNLDTLIQELHTLSSTYSVANFSTVLATSQLKEIIDYCLDEKKKPVKHLKILTKLIHELPEIENFIKVSVPLLFEFSSEVELIESCLVDILSLFEARYPKETDAAFDSLQVQYKNHKFLDQFFSKTQHEKLRSEMNMQSQITSQLRVKGRRPKIDSILQIQEVLESNPSPSFIEFAKYQIISNLKSTDIELLNSVLRMKQLSKIIKLEEMIPLLVESLEVIMSEHKPSEYAVIVDAIFNSVITSSVLKDLKAIETILPIILLVVFSSEEILQAIVLPKIQKMNFALFENAATCQIQSDLLKVIAKNVLAQESLKSKLIHAAGESVATKMTVIFILLSVSKISKNISYLTEVLSLMKSIYASVENRHPPIFAATPKKISQVTPTNLASFVVLKVLKLVKKFGQISIKQLISSFGSSMDDAARIIKDITEMIFDSPIARSHKHLEQLIQLLGVDIAIYLMEFVNRPISDHIIEQALSVVLMTVKSQSASMQSILPPLFAVLASLNSSRRSKELCIEILQCIGTTEEIYNPLSIKSLKQTELKLLKSHIINDSATFIDGMTQTILKGYRGSVSTIAKFFGSYMQVSQNTELFLRLQNLLLTYEPTNHRDITTSLLNFVIQPLIVRLEKSRHYESVGQFQLLTQFLDYFIESTVKKQSIISSDISFILQVMRLSSITLKSNEKFFTLSELNIVSPSEYLSKLLNRSNFDHVFANQLDVSEKRKFIYVFCDILQSNERGSSKFVNYVELISSLHLDAEVVLGMLKEDGEFKTQSTIIEVLTNCQVAPDGQLVTAIFEIMRRYLDNRLEADIHKTHSPQSSDDDMSDDESSDSDSSTSSDSDSNTSSDSDSNDTDSNDSSDSSDSDSDMSDAEDSEVENIPRRKIAQNDKLSIHDSLFCISCFTVLNSILTSDSKRDEIKKCVENFDLEETLRILSLSEHPQLLTTAMMCIDSIAEIFTQKILNFVERIVQVISDSFIKSNVIGMEISERLIVQLMPHVTKNPDDIFPFMNMLIGCFHRIPESKRLPLYTLMLKCLSREHIFSIVVLFLESFIDTSLGDYLAFSSQLLSYFKIDKQLNCIMKISDIVLNILSRPEDAVAIRSKALFGVTIDQAKRDNRFIGGLISILMKFVHDTTNDTSFLRRLNESLTSIDSEAEKITYKDTIQQFIININTILIAIMSITKQLQYERRRKMELHEVVLYTHIEQIFTSSSSTFDMLQQMMDAKSNAKMYTSLIKSSSSVYKKVLSITDEGRVVKIQAKSIELLNSLLADLTFENNEFLEKNAEYYTDLPSKLTKYILKKGNSIDRNVQLSTICIDQLARRFASEAPSKFIKSIEALLQRLENSTNHILQVSYSLALASICGHALQEDGEEGFVIPEDLITHIPSVFYQIVETVLRFFNNSSFNDKILSLFVFGMVSSIDLLLSKCSRYSYPFLSGIVDVFIHLSTYSFGPKIISLIDSAISSMTESIPARVLIRPLFSSLETAQRIGSKSLISLFSIITTVFSKISTSEALQILPIVEKFYFQAFETRIVHEQNGSSSNIDNIDNVEYEILDSFKQYILKLDEKEFKPIINNLYKWASSGVEVNLGKKRVFYRAVLTISETLKSLFVPFWSDILTSTLKDLNDCICDLTPKKKRKRDQDEGHLENLHYISIFIADSLKILFLSDTKRRGLKDDIVVQDLSNALISQLVNLGCGDLSLYESRIQGHIIPAMTAIVPIIPQKDWGDYQKQLIRSITSTLEQDLNTSQKSQLQVCSIEAIHSIYKENKGIISQLSDLLPFISELLEEDDPQVQQALGTLIQYLQKESGEDIREYLSRV